MSDHFSYCQKILDFVDLERDTLFYSFRDWFRFLDG